MYKKIGILLLFFCLTLFYLYPLLQGLILLPLDMLISNYSPWYNPGTILLKNPYMQDSIVQLFPWRHLVFQSLTEGIIPLWNPYQHLGLPFMASLKPMVFYPLNILFIFGEINAWNMLLFAQIFLGMLFAYFLARDFKLKIFPSILSSFAFGLSSYMVGLLEFGSDAHTLIWFPLIFLFVKRYIEKQKGKYLLFLGITIAISIFAGQLQYLSYFMILLLAFIFYYGRSLKTKKSVYIFIFISITLGFGISAIQLLPGIELFTHSHRGLLSAEQNHNVFSRGLVQLYEHLRLFSPDFFGNPVTRDATSGYIETSGYFGIIPFFFALFAMVFARRKPFVKFLTITFIVAILFSLQWIGEALYLLKIPVLTSGEANRIFTLVLFSGAFLAGFGLTEFIEMKNKRRNYLSLISFILILFISIIIYALFFKETNISTSVLFQHIKFSTIILSIFSIITFIYLFSLKWKKYENLFKILFLLFIVALTFLDLFRMGYRFLTFSNEKFFFPQMEVTTFIQNESKKTLGRTYGLTEPELGTYLNIYTIETYNPLYLLRTSTLLQALQNQPNQALSIDNKYFLTSTGDDLKNAIDFLGTYYIVTTKDENPSTKYFKTNKFEQDFKKIYSDERYSVYKNLQAYPRFGLYYQDNIINDNKKLLNSISKGEINLRKNIIFEENIPIVLQEGTGSAQLISTTVNSQTFSAISDKPTIFYISDTFYPGWKAKVNNQDTKIYRANYNFRAVLLPKGESTIEFTYLPISFLMGSFISLLSTFVLILLAYKVKK